MSETGHQKAQREARERKKVWKERRLRELACANRRVQLISLPKEQMLSLLKWSLVAPEDATKIIGTGHTPDFLTITVAFD